MAFKTRKRRAEVSLDTSRPQKKAHTPGKSPMGKKKSKMKKTPVTVDSKMSSSLKNTFTPGKSFGKPGKKEGMKPLKTDEKPSNKGSYKAHITSRRYQRDVNRARGEGKFAGNRGREYNFLSSKKLAVEIKQDKMPQHKEVVSTKKELNKIRELEDDRQKLHERLLCVTFHDMITEDDLRNLLPDVESVFVRTCIIQMKNAESRIKAEQKLKAKDAKCVYSNSVNRRKPGNSVDLCQLHVSCKKSILSKGLLMSCFQEYNCRNAYVHFNSFGTGHNGFVYFNNPEDALKAFNETQYMTVRGNLLQITYGVLTDKRDKVVRKDKKSVQKEEESDKESEDVLKGKESDEDQENEEESVAEEESEREESEDESADVVKRKQSVEKKMSENASEEDEENEEEEEDVGEEEESKVENAEVSDEGKCDKAEKEDESGDDEDDSNDEED